MPAALAVVVVGDDGGAQPGQGAEQVQAREPPWLLADLVDLVDGERVGSQGDRGGAAHDERAAAVDDLGQADGHGGVDPLAQGVGGAAGTCEGPAGATDSSKGPLASCRGLVATAPGGHAEIGSDRVPEVLGDLVGEVVGVGLEAERRIKHGEVPAGHGGDQFTVHLDHRGRGLTRTDDDKTSGHPPSVLDECPLACWGIRSTGQDPRRSGWARACWGGSTG